MKTTITIIDGPLPPAEPWVCDGAGALVSFEGVVRLLEEGRELAALDYEAYEPMASAELRRLADAIKEEHGLLAIAVEHSRGSVAVGEVSFRLRVAGRHRKEALAAMDAFIDRMKRDVPIWKTPLWKAAETTA